MDYNFINLQLERRIKAELSDLLEADIVKEIMRQGKIDQEQNSFRTIHEGHSFKITENLLPKLHQICNEVKDALDFEEPLDFYVTNSPDINAAALPKFEDDESHLLVFNSGLIEKFDSAELKFVIGHEIGHLISKNAEFNRIINFVFPDGERIPLIFRNKLRLWQQLSEIAADRYGFVASPKFDKCITNFFKLSSGLSRDAELINPNAYMEMVDGEIHKFAESPKPSSVSHPVHPVRVKALQYFSQSKLFEKIQKKQPLKEDEKLSKKIEELVPLLTSLKTSEVDYHRSNFIAAAGFMVAMADKQAAEQEIEAIIDVLSQLEVFPKAFLGQIINTKKVEEYFIGSANAILQINPAERFPMFEYMISIALRDREINSEEIAFLYGAGRDIFGLEKKEIAQLIGKTIQEKFIPKIFAN